MHEGQQPLFELKGNSINERGNVQPFEMTRVALKWM